jgi:hypothetical protein
VQTLRNVQAPVRPHNTPLGEVKQNAVHLYRDGTTHVICEPENFIALCAALCAALVPRPRAHLTRYGVVAPAISWSDRFVGLINTRATVRDGRW